MLPGSRRRKKEKSGRRERHSPLNDGVIESWLLQLLLFYVFLLLLLRVYKYAGTAINHAITGATGSAPLMAAAAKEEEPAKTL